MFNDTYSTGRTYRGHNIDRANGSGYWSTRVDDYSSVAPAGRLMADTLAGLKEGIRLHLAEISNH